MNNRPRRSMTIHRYGRRGVEPQRAQGAFDPLVTVTLVQSIFCILFVIGVFTLQFFNQPQYEQVGNYYKAAMGEEMGEAVLVGSFGQLLDWDCLQQYVNGLPKEIAMKFAATQTKPGPAGWQDQENPGVEAVQEALAPDLIEDFWEGRESRALGVGERGAVIPAEAEHPQMGQGGGSDSIPTNVYYGPVFFTAAAHPPAYGVITSRFGLRSHPITNQMDFHTGIDVAAPQGESVYAIYSGEVTEVGFSNIYGHYIQVRHSPRLTSFYGHCSRILPQEGAMVRGGERIGEVGTTGLSTGPHVHLSVLVDGRYIDPMTLYAV